MAKLHLAIIALATVVSAQRMGNTSSKAPQYLYQYGTPKTTSCRPYERVCGDFAKDADALEAMSTDDELHYFSKTAVYNNYYSLVTASTKDGATAVGKYKEWCRNGASHAKMLEYLTAVSKRVDFSPGKLAETLATDNSVFYAFAAASGMESISKKILYMDSASLNWNPLGYSYDYGTVEEDGTFVEVDGAREKVSTIMNELIDVFGAGSFFDDKNPNLMSVMLDLEFALAKCTEISTLDVYLNESEVEANKDAFPVDYDTFLASAVAFTQKNICPSGKPNNCFQGLTSFIKSYGQCLKDEIFNAFSPENIKKFYLWRTLFKARFDFGTDLLFKTWKPLAPEWNPSYNNREEYCIAEASEIFPYHYVQNVMKTSKFQAGMKQLNETFKNAKGGFMKVMKSWKLPSAEKKEFNERIQRLVFAGLQLENRDFNVSNAPVLKADQLFASARNNILARQEEMLKELQRVGAPNDDVYSPYVRLPVQYFIAAHAFKYDPLVVMHQMSTIISQQSISLAALHYNLDFTSTTPTSSPVALYNCTFGQFKRATNSSIKKSALLEGFWTSSHWSKLGSENIALRATWNTYSETAKSPCKSAFLENYAFANCGSQTGYLDSAADLDPKVVNYAINSFLSDFGAIEKCAPPMPKYGRCLPRGRK